MSSCTEGKSAWLGVEKKVVKTYLWTKTDLLAVVRTLRNDCS